MVQQLIILLVFVAAAFYIGRLIYQSFRGKTGCVKGCGSACATINFDKIQQGIRFSAKR